LCILMKYEMARILDFKSTLNSNKFWFRVVRVHIENEFTSG
jgi:hypothetical protein